MRKIISLLVVLSMFMLVGFSIIDNNNGDLEASRETEGDSLIKSDEIVKTCNRLDVKGEGIDKIRESYKKISEMEEELKEEGYKLSSNIKTNNSSKEEMINKLKDNYKKISEEEKELKKLADELEEIIKSQQLKK
ncbi:hypothetical protein [Dethiothermospora halolimnae]|uniref:hypothetical protein n=1 Tax=Dethiothermospora halolimnae TaxID=3114390 RepID=UPI003CCB8DBA